MVFLGPKLFSQPIIGSFSPSAGGIGSTVIINGSNFSSTAANNIVFFGAVKANVVAATVSQLTVTVPAGSSYQPITVTVNNLTAYSNLPFLVTFAGSGGAAFAPNSMAPKTDYASGKLPAAIVVADFDGDGKPDIADINVSSRSLSLLKNTGAAGNISFLAAGNYPTGGLPLSIISGDLDGDGKPDLVVANDSSNTVSVYRNTSSGGNISFAASLDLATGNGPVAVTMIDLDGDGRPDLAVANSNSGSISVFKNTSTAGILSFDPKSDFLTGTSLQGIASADLDGDGKPDLVVANGNSNTVSVFRNTSVAGTISLATRLDYGGSFFPIWVSIADVDGDGKPDLVTSSVNSPAVYVLRNNSSVGTISFNSALNFPVGTTSFAVSIADIDGDGKPDLCAANSTASNISILRNTSGAGIISFETKVDYAVGTNPWAIVASDLDGDGKPDIATANSKSDSISILRNTVSPLNIYSFSPVATGTDSTVTITGSAFTGATGVSFGGTAAASFIVASPTIITAVVAGGTTGDVSVTTATGTVSQPGFTFIPRPVVTAFTPTIAGTGTVVKISGSNFTGATAVSFGGSPAASFTVDSSKQITAIVGAGTTGDVSVITPGGTGMLSGFIYVPPPLISSFSPANAVAGTTLTISGSNFLGTTAVYIGENPAASFTVVSAALITAVIPGATGGNITVITPYGTSILPGFYNGIKINSVGPLSGPIGTSVTITGSNFSANTADNGVYFGAVSAPVTAASPTSLTVTVPVASSFEPVSVISSNLVAYANSAFDISFPGSGSGFDSSSFEPGINIPAGTTPYNFSIADLDGDGKPDLAVPTGTAVSVYRNTGSNGNISFDPKIDYPATINQPYVAVSVGDLDGDGKLDLIVNKDYSTQIALFRNMSSPGSIAFDTAGIIDVSVEGNAYEKVSVADFDGDGKIDLAITSSNQNTVLIYRNTSHAGIISFAPPVKYATGEQPLSMTVGDFDGDGRPDMAVSNFLDSISVYKNTSNYGSISFANPLNYVVGVALGQIKAADVDADGKMDLIIASHIDSSISVLRNTGSPGVISFSNKISFATGSNPYSYCVGDLDGDGKPDLAVMNINSQTVSVLKNNSTAGAISFSQKIDYATEQDPVSIAIGDLDGDGKPDFAVTHFNGNVVSIFRNAVGPLLSPHIFSFAPAAATTGDTVTIKGIHFTGADTVRFGGMIASSFTVNSDTTITAVVGTGASGSVVVSTAIGVAARTGFQFILLPKIISFSPTTGGTGATITIRGSHFTGTTAVSFGDSAAGSFIVVSDSVITAMVGIGATGSVKITAAGRTDTLSGFVFIANQLNEPFQLVSFKGILLNNLARLQWQAVNEESTSHYNIERSADSLSAYSAIDTVKPLDLAGASNNYDYPDPGIQAGNNYYRLRIVDTSGNSSYSAVVNIRLAVNAPMRAFPNPTTSMLTLNHPVSTTTTQIVLTDMMGRIVKTITVNPNVSQTLINLSGIIKGVYMIKWSDGSNSIKQEILVE